MVDHAPGYLVGVYSGDRQQQIGEDLAASRAL